MFSVPVMVLVLVRINNITLLLNDNPMKQLTAFNVLSVHLNSKLTWNTLMIETEVGLLRQLQYILLKYILLFICTPRKQFVILFTKKCMRGVHVRQDFSRASM